MNSEFSLPSPNEPQSEPDSRTATPAELELDALVREIARQEARNLQLAADFVNFKRRSQMESETRAAAQKESFIQELLPVIDNLERALDSGASPLLLQGVEMTRRQMLQLLSGHGIETEASVGQPFDPRRHEAVSQRCDPAHPDQAILEVFQHGYHRNGEVFRPAKVVVNNLEPTRESRDVD